MLSGPYHRLNDSYIRRRSIHTVDIGVNISERKCGTERKKKRKKRESIFFPPTGGTTYTVIHRLNLHGFCPS